MIKSKQILSIILLTYFIHLFNTSEAHFGSKGPFGGHVSCIITTDTMAYIGTENGGVYESTNSMIQVWRARPVGLKSGKITALAHTGSYLFSATADSGVFRFTGYVGSDRYWEKVNNGITQLQMKSLLALDSITVLAGTDGGGLFKTINNGVSWNAVSSTPLNGAVITDMAKSTDRIFLSTLTGGIFISDNGGDNWMDFNDANTLGIGGSNRLSYNSSTDELMILNDSGLFICSSASLAGSAVFIPAGNGLSSFNGINDLSNDGSTWYLATEDGVYSTVTGILNWSLQNTGMPAQSIRAIGSVQNMVIAGSRENGIFKTPAASVNWSPVNTNFNNLRTHSMITKDTTLVVAATEKGVFVSTDLASSYTASNNGLTDSLFVNDICFFGNTLVAVTIYQGVFISQDTGKSWTQFNPNLTQMDVRKVYSSSNYVYIIDGPGDIFQSDLVNGWNMIMTGLPFAVQPTSIAFYNNNIVLGTEGDGVFVRAESGGNWSQIITGLTDLNVMAVTASTTHIFAGTRNSGVFVSDISSLTWTAAAAISIPHTSMLELETNKIQAMAFYRGYVYASYRGGLVATSDNGSSWIEAGNQFNLPTYTNVRKISHVTTRVFVTTDNNSLYSNSLSELPPLGISELNREMNNDNLLVSPNPAKGSFKTWLSDKNVKIELLRVLDFQGKLILELRGGQNALEVNDLDELSSGLYYVQAFTGKEILVQKLMINQ